MNRIALLIVMVFTVNSAMACDFSKEIEKLPDGRFAYSKDCHLAVGEMKWTLTNQAEQISELKKTIDLKDLALVKSNQNSQLWMDTSFKMQDKFNSYESIQSKNNTTHFLAGVGLTVLTAWALGQVTK